LLVLFIGGSGLIFHFTGIFHINGSVAAIQIDDDRDGDSGFSRSYRDDKYGEKDAVEFFRIEIFIKHNKVDVHTIQNQFNRHQHGNEITPGEQAIHPDKE
jgi:hypothetical protein